MKLLPFVILWAVLASVVLFLALYRRIIATKEDDTLHVSHVEGNAVSQQTEFAKRLEVIDRWGKLLTIVAAVFGLVLLAAYLYIGWQQGGQMSD